MNGEIPSTPSIPVSPGGTLPKIRIASGGARRRIGSWNRFRLFETVRDLESGTETLRRRRYGVIEARQGRLRRVLLRPFPKVVSLYEVKTALFFQCWRPSRDRCLIYYNAPWGCPGYLAIRYFLSDRQCSLRTVHAALATLDEIARLRGTLALVCDAANPRLSHRMMQRYGWTSHCEHLLGRHFIKRF